MFTNLISREVRKVMLKRIKHISFLYKNERLLIEANKQGKFRVPVTNGSKTKYKLFTAREVLDLTEIKAGDPSVTMENGEKLRIYQGGDPSYLPAAAEGILLAHDRQFKTSPPKVPTPPSKGHSDGSYDSQEQEYFDWYSESHGF